MTVFQIEKPSNQELNELAKATQREKSQGPRMVGGAPRAGPFVRAWFCPDVGVMGLSLGSTLESPGDLFKYTDAQATDSKDLNVLPGPASEFV